MFTKNITKHHTDFAFAGSSKKGKQFARNPDGKKRIDGTDVAVSYWVADGSSQNSGQIYVGFDRVSTAKDGTERLNRTFRLDTDDLVGVGLALVAVWSRFATEPSIPAFDRQRYFALAEAVQGAIVQAITPRKRPASVERKLEITPSVNGNGAFPASAANSLF